MRDATPVVTMPDAALNPVARWDRLFLSACCDDTQASRLLCPCRVQGRMRFLPAASASIHRFLFNEHKTETA
jgi:hypothetical protein